jgi:hypothetical protein
MPQRFTNPVIKYTTDTLKTLPGALLYFYENGTSTPKVVYQDVALTTPHTNPVVASSAGNFAPIFLAGTYRVELKSAAGVTQSGWPVDNVGGEETQGQFDDWSSITSYYEGDLVTGSNGLRYQAKALQPNLNRDPLTSPTYWQEVRFTSEYNALSTYAVGDWVYYLGNWYKCKVIATGQTPSVNSAYWDAEKNLFQWNSTTTYAANAYVFEGDIRYKSMQGTNLNHTPTDAGDAWWIPEWMTIPAFNEVLSLSGGGTLTARFAHELNDSSTYTIPAANSVPAKTVFVAGKTDQYKGQNPVVQRSGSDVIRYGGGTDTSLRFSAPYGHSLRFVSNGSNEWSI